MKIPGYTLHGDYYLADEVIPNKTWKEACEMKMVVALPNNKIAIAHILLLGELCNILYKERSCDKWYWTGSLFDNDKAWCITNHGLLFQYDINSTINVRLGFHKNEIKQSLLAVE